MVNVRKNRSVNLSTVCGVQLQPGEMAAAPLSKPATECHLIHLVCSRIEPDSLSFRKSANQKRVECLIYFDIVS